MRSGVASPLSMELPAAAVSVPRLAREITFNRYGATLMAALTEYTFRAAVLLYSSPGSISLLFLRYDIYLARASEREREIESAGGVF